MAFCAPAHATHVAAAAHSAELPADACCFHLLQRDDVLDWPREFPKQVLLLLMTCCRFRHPCLHSW